MSRRSRGLFYALLLLHLAPIWSFDQLATQDGPSHLANAEILLRLWSGDCPIVSEYYRFHGKLFPNWLGPLFLAGLGTLFSPSLAEKLLQSAYVVLFALSMRLVILRIEPENAFLSIAVFPLVYSYPFLMGFYGFSLGLACLLFLLAYWVEHRDRPGVAKAAPLALLALVCLFLHPLPFLAGCVFVAVLALPGPAIGAPRAAVSFRGVGRSLGARLLVPLLALLPALLLFVVYLATSSGRGRWLWLSPGQSLLKLLTHHHLVAYSDAEMFFSVPVSLVLLASGARALRGDRRASLHPLGRGLLAGAGLLLLACFLTPDFSPRGGFLSDRMLLLFCLALVPWLATRRYSRSAAIAFQAAIAIASVGLVGVKARMLVEVNSYLAEYLSAGDLIEEGRTLIPLNFLPGNALRHGEPSSRVDPLFHASNYIAAEKCVVSLNNYEAGYAGHFPVLYRAGLNPYEVAGYDEYAPERVGLRRYAARTGKPIDYVLTWGAREALRRGSAETKRGIEQRLRELRGGYDLLYTSTGRGWLRLYRRRGLREPDPGVE